MLWLAIAAPARAQEKAPEVPFVPTPVPVVERMLELAAVGPGDVVYDLGSGDGRMVILAAKRGARGYGVDLNPVWVRDARANAESAGVADRTRFEVGDLFETDLSPATVVVFYLLPHVNLKLRAKLDRELRPGTRIVSHEYEIGDDWPPDHSEAMDVAGRRHTVHVWTVRPR